MLTSIYFLVFAAVQLPMGVLLDRYGARIVTTLTFAVGGVGCLIAALVPTGSLAAPSDMRAAITGLFGDRPLRVELLTNRVTGNDRREVLAGLADGSVDLWAEVARRC